MASPPPDADSDSNDSVMHEGSSSMGGDRSSSSSLHLSSGGCDAFRPSPSPSESLNGDSLWEMKQNNENLRGNIYNAHCGWGQYPRQWDRQPPPTSPPSSPYVPHSPPAYPPSSTLYTSIDPILLEEPFSSMTIGSGLTTSLRGVKTRRPDIRRTSDSEHHPSFSRSVRHLPPSPSVSDVPMPIFLDDVPLRDGDSSSSWSLSPRSTPARPESRALPGLEWSPNGYGYARTRISAIRATPQIHRNAPPHAASTLPSMYDD